MMEGNIETGNILNDLFTDVPDVSVPGLEGLIELIYQNRLSTEDTLDVAKRETFQQNTETRIRKKKVT